MTDKEIIIDGINVAECEYLRIVGANWWCECNNGKEYGTKTRVTACGGCKYNPNCYYKQLKRIEQELKIEEQDRKYIKECCIRAGKELSKHSFEWDGKEKNLVVQAMQLNEDYERLEQENEKLKEENVKLQNRNQQLSGAITQNLIYKQALEEIRGISKQCMTKDLCSIDCDYAYRCYIEDEEVPTYDICKLIIEKINEVLK